MKKPSVLFATSELHPLVKTGGLADVSQALPAALTALGVDVRVLLPGYPAVLDGARLRCVRARIELLPGLPPARLLRGRLPGAETRLYVMDCPALFERDGGPYLDPHGVDWSDNHLRFGALSRLAALLGSRASPIRWRPRVVHCNDWQTGLAPAYLAFDPARACGSVISVHNIAFAGRFAPTTMAALALPPESYSMHGLEFYGDIAFLKAGLYYADHITTVSPSYAREIQTPAHGGGLHGLLATRRDALTGILNGIDTAAWDPRRDPHLERAYGPRDFAGKSVDKRALQQQLSLPVEPDTPLIGMVTRLSHQKGIDLAVSVIEHLRSAQVQFAILGSGEAALEGALVRLAESLPAQVGVRLGYDEALAHRIEAGADLFMMPSRYEPCGLNQMYSMRYGTLPLVTRTGGLADSVVDVSRDSLRDKTASGFVVAEPSVEALERGLRRALELYLDPHTWRRVQRNAMRRDWSWRKSAEAYLEVYRRAARAAG